MRDHKVLPFVLPPPLVCQLVRGIAALNKRGHSFRAEHIKSLMRPRLETYEVPLVHSFRSLITEAQLDLTPDPVFNTRVACFSLPPDASSVRALVQAPFAATKLLQHSLLFPRLRPHDGRDNPDRSQRRLELFLTTLLSHGVHGSQRNGHSPVVVTCFAKFYLRSAKGSLCPALCCDLWKRVELLRFGIYDFIYIISRNEIISLAFEYGIPTRSAA